MLRTIANNAEIDVIWENYQEQLEPLQERLNAAVGESWEEWEIPPDVDPAWPDDVKTLYTDSKHGFRVMAHTNRGPSSNTPHCHGPSWVVYGMAMNHVEMTEWERLDDGTRDGHAELAPARKYVLGCSQARVYNQGVIHSLDRPLETRLVRVTGCDLDRTLRYRYDPANNRVKVLEPQPA